MGLFSRIMGNGDDGIKRTPEEEILHSVHNFVLPVRPIGSIGTVPSESMSFISLREEDKVLCIAGGGGTAIIPVARVRGLSSEYRRNRGDNAFARGLAGGIVAGATGAVIGAMTARTQTSGWIEHLTYEDKYGNARQHSFLVVSMIDKVYDGVGRNIIMNKMEQAVGDLVRLQRGDEREETVI